jgi:starvation-inducible outer membrane lipoprotein
MRATNLGALSLSFLLAACTSPPQGAAPPRAPDRASSPTSGVAWSFDTGG